MFSAKTTLACLAMGEPHGVGEQDDEDAALGGDLCHRLHFLLVAAYVEKHENVARRPHVEHILRPVAAVRRNQRHARADDLQMREEIVGQSMRDAAAAR